MQNNKVKSKSTGEKETNKKPEEYLVRLRVSEDGQVLVNEKGMELMRLDGKIIAHPSTIKCDGWIEWVLTNCRDECIAWDGNGKCVKTYRTCDIVPVCHPNPPRSKS